MLTAFAAGLAGWRDAVLSGNAYKTGCAAESLTLNMRAPVAMLTGATSACIYCARALKCLKKQTAGYFFAASLPSAGRYASCSTTGLADRLRIQILSISTPSENAIAKYT